MTTVHRERLSRKYSRASWMAAHVLLVLFMLGVDLRRTTSTTILPLAAAFSVTNQRDHHHHDIPTFSRREWLAQSAVAGAAVTQVLLAPAPVRATDDALPLVQQSIKQLQQVPQLIKEERWDAVRNLLIQPPLADIWQSTPASKELWNKILDSATDELQVLDARVELQSHGRYLDMAVYNNIFSPIKEQGETGATRGLVKSYYEDPVNEYAACKDGLSELEKLLN